jgi:hypothetical protein
VSLNDKKDVARLEEMTVTTDLKRKKIPPKLPLQPTPMMVGIAMGTGHNKQVLMKRANQPKL